MSDVSATAIVVTGKFHRVQRGHKKTFETSAPPQPTPVRKPARVAISLALAHKIQQAIDRGHIRGPAEAARRLGLTRARLTQLLNLTLLAPEIQERILFAEAVDGIEPMSERGLRPMTRVDRQGRVGRITGSRTQAVHRVTSPPT